MFTSKKALACLIGALPICISDQAGHVYQVSAFKRMTAVIFSLPLPFTEGFRPGNFIRVLKQPTTSPQLAACMSASCVQGDLFGASFSLDTAGVSDLPKDILIPGRQAIKILEAE